MATDDKKSITVPPFESQLPPEFLEGLDHRGQYLYTKMDEIVQTQKWLTEQTVAQNTTLQEVKVQVLKTNGRLLKAEDDIGQLKNTQKEMQDDIKLIRVVKHIAVSKWFWIGVGAFLVFGVPWLATHASTASAFFKFIFA